MSEVMAQRQPIKPTYAIPIIPVTNSSPFKHQETMELKEFKVNKVSSVSNGINSSCCYMCKLQDKTVENIFNWVGGDTLSDRGKTLLLAGKIQQQSCNRSKILHSAGVMIIAWELLEFLKTEIKGV